MSGRARFYELREQLEFLLAKHRGQRARGLHLIVTHLDQAPSTLCAPGEMIGDIAIGGVAEPHSLGLSHMSLLLFDCLCRRRMPLTAIGIEQIMNTDPFYVHYAANRIGGNPVIARPDRRTVRVYVPRIRRRIGIVLARLGLAIDPADVLISDQSESNVLTYKVKATVEVLHVEESGDRWLMQRTPCPSPHRQIRLARCD
jgi:hypothetical protein